MLWCWKLPYFRVGELRLLGEERLPLPLWWTDLWFEFLFPLAKILLGEIGGPFLWKDVCWFTFL